MKIDFKEGFYRIFILFAYAGGILTVISLLHNINDFWIAVLLGVLCGIIIYLSFFILEWLIAGFNKEITPEHAGLKKFVKEIINRTVEKNYRKPFFFLLIMLIPLILSAIVLTYRLFDYYQMKDENKIMMGDIYRLENELDELKRKNLEILSQEKNTASCDLPEEVLDEYYSIGSSKEEVLKIQGQPQEINTYTYSGTVYDTWKYKSNYSFSVIKFENGKVKEYSDNSNILKIKGFKK